MSTVNAVPAPETIGYSFWWVLKLVGSLGLLAYAVIALLGYSPLTPLFPAATLVAQVVVIVGAITNIGHYLLLKRAAPNLSMPDALVARGGLFSLIRNPMYFGDLLVMTGFALLRPDAASIALFAIVTVSVAKQCGVEEKGLRARFPDAFAEWETRSKRLLPYIW